MSPERMRCGVAYHDDVTVVERRHHRRTADPDPLPRQQNSRHSVHAPLRAAGSRVHEGVVRLLTSRRSDRCGCSDPRVTAYAHCDLPCGVYDPAQARIEAESVKAIMEKYQGNDDPVFRTRALIIKEQRAELVKHHLWVLWTDYFKPPHFEKYPQLHDLFNRATKAAGAAGGKGAVDPAEGQKLLDLIAEIDTIFWETKKAA